MVLSLDFYGQPDAKVVWHVLRHPCRVMVAPACVCVCVFRVLQLLAVSLNVLVLSTQRVNNESPNCTDIEGRHYDVPDMVSAGCISHDVLHGLHRQ